MRALFFSILISAGLVFAFNPEVRAAPAGGGALSEIGGQSDALVLVRDRCGRGRHFSKWRGICVWNSGPRVYAPPVYGPPVYGPPVYGYGYYGGYPAYGYPVYGYRRYYW